MTNNAATRSPRGTWTGMVCSGPGQNPGELCGRGINGRGLCSTHGRQDTLGQPLRPIKSKVPAGTWTGVTCYGPDCDRAVIAKGLCNSHRYQDEAGLPLTPLGPTPQPQAATCQGPDCDEKPVSHSLCSAHYGQERAGKVLVPIRPHTQWGTWVGKSCGAPLCQKKISGRGFCIGHAKYNCSSEKLYAMFDAQDGRCPICDDSFLEILATSPDRIPYHIDHDHACCPARGGSCGECVRGLLCRRCNHLLGNARDDLRILTSAGSYLTSWRTTL